MVNLSDAKTDDRPQRGWWAPGNYIGTCARCKDPFIGDKRAGNCADCAYAEPDSAPSVPTHADFIRGASFIASRAAQWSGEIAIGFMADMGKPGEPMDADALRRFRASILELLNSITPQT